MKRLLLAFALLSGLSTSVLADEALIKDVERLRDALPAKDLKGRQSLTIRLADLLFNEVTKASSNSDGSPAVESKITNMRNRSALLYEEALSGQGGKVPVPADPQKTAMEYRLSRVYADQGQDKKARAIWKELIHRTAYPQIASESAMSLGEISETDGTEAGRKLAYECYDIAIQYGKDQDAVSYGHYRKAWLLRNDNQLKAAIDALKASLYDSKGHVREEALKDLLTFTALDPGTVTEAIPYFQTLSEKLTRKELLNQLAEAYFAAGYKPQGVMVLTEYNKKNPNVLSQVRLLEELYGQRKWADFRHVMSQITDSPDVLKLDVANEEGKQVEATLRRLSVQVDAERKTDPSITADFISVTDLYLQAFPKSNLRFKMVEGSLAAEQDPARKAARLEALLANKRVQWPPEELAPMREQLVSIYQKQENHKAAAAMLALLMADAKTKEDVRRFKFVQASELFDMKKHEDAAKLFEELVKENPHDKIGVKSQVSLVKILGREKKFDQILAATEGWLPAAQSKNDPAASADVKLVADIREESEFEWAANLGKDPKALVIFKKACFAGKFLPKSCENTRVLSLQLEDHATYISLLKKDGKDAEIASYYEEIGMFQEAAQAQEKLDLKKDSDIKAHLKIAILYEIAGDTANNDRMIKTAIKPLYGKKFTSADEEDLIYITMRDNKMINPAALSLPWTEGRRCYLANRFEEEGQGSEQNRKIILSCKAAPGKAWAKLVLPKAYSLAEQAKKINFYGANSKKKFEQRIAALKVLNQYIEQYFGAADVASRKELATIGKDAYGAFAEEIMNSPVPQMPTPEEDAAVKNSLTQMATPFAERSKEFEKLVSDQPAEDPTIAAAPVEKVAKPVNLSEMLAKYKFLAVADKRKQTLAEIKDVYEQSDNIRLAAYFKGRLNQLDSANAAAH